MLFRFVWLTLLFSISTWVQGQHTSVQLSEAQAVYPIGAYVDYLEDPRGTFTLDQVRRSARYKHSAQTTPSFGFSESVYWFRLRLRNQSANSDVRWLLELGYSHFRAVDLYIFNRVGQQIGQIRAGNSRGIKHRPLSTHNYVFPVRLPVEQEVTVYLRCDGMASKLFPLVIYEEHIFYEYAQNTSLWLGFYFGFLFITILYHFILFLYNRNKSYLLFSAYLFAYLLNELIRGNGNYFERLFLVYHPFWQEHVVALLNGVIMLVSLLGLRFYSVSLQLAPTGWMHKWLVRLAQINVLLYILLLTSLFPTSYSLLYNFVVPLVAYSTVLYCSFVRSIEGYRPAWYYFGGTLALLIGVSIVLLDRSGTLSDTSFWQHNAIPAASVVEIILLSLGFAEAIRTDRRRRKVELEFSNLAGRKSEREWLSILLHTSFGTTLSTMLYELSQIDYSQLSTKNLSIIHRVKEQLTNSLSELRILTRSLPPTLLEEQGLKAALTTLLENYNRRGQVQFQLISKGKEILLQPQCEFEIYLIGLELVSNVIRHAHATSAWLELLWEGNSLIVRMRDNGIGFASNSSDNGYGLNGIRRIIQQNLHGSVSIETVPGGGSSVVVQVLLQDDVIIKPLFTKRTPVQRLFGVIRSYF